MIQITVKMGKEPLRNWVVGNKTTSASSAQTVKIIWGGFNPENIPISPYSKPANPGQGIGYSKFRSSMQEHRTRFQEGEQSPGENALRHVEQPRLQADESEKEQHTK